MGIFNKVKERERKLCPETPGKHPGNTQETPMKTPHKRSRFRKKKSLAKLVGILNKEKEKNIAPVKHPGNNQGKVHLLMFLIKGKKILYQKFKRGWNLVTTMQIYVPVWGYWTIFEFP